MCSFSHSAEAGNKRLCSVRLDDVDLQRERVEIGADGLAKNRESRTVELNPKLEALLREVLSRRPPDSCWCHRLTVAQSFLADATEWLYEMIFQL
ncbi:MAG TPA: hypothetical protein VGK91_04245 [Candidatus Udaeobacter sp.]|jgi:integrase